MSNIKKSLDNIFDVKVSEDFDAKISQPTVIGSPQKITPIKSEEIQSVKKTEEEWEHDDDFQTVRENLRELTEKGKTALDGILSVAVDTDKPSAFEAAAVLIKTMADVNKDLYDLHKKRKQTRGESDERIHPSNISVEKAVFVGTTADLLKQVNAELEEAKAKK